jgi:carbamoylphosphate synthase large subunit
MKALVTNCTRNSGLTVMRALSATGWSVLGADDRVFAFGLRSRCAIARYERLPAEDDPAFTAALLCLLDRLRPDVLIPTRGIEAACRARDAVASRTRCLLPTPEAFEILHDKARLLERCAALNIAVPRVFRPDEAVQYLKGAPGSRVVVKPRRDVGGGRNVHFVADPSAIFAVHRRVTAEHGGALINDYIPGPVDNLRAVHLLFDSANRLISFFVLRKLRIWPAGVGITVAAVSTHETALVTGLLPLFQRLKWQGPADAEFKIDERDGTARILEINPRFSGAIHFPIACGVNMPQLYCRAALGERLEEATCPVYPAGSYYLNAGRWLAGVFAELREPSSNRWAVLRRAWSEELRQPRVPSVHAFGDPGPWLGKILTSRNHA